MKWEELDEETQEKVCEKHRDWFVSDEFWFDSVLENWKEKLEERGFYGVKRIYFSGLDGNGSVSFDSNFHLLDFLKYFKLRNKFRRLYVNYDGCVYFHGWVQSIRDNAYFNADYRSYDEGKKYDLYEADFKRLVEVIEEKLIDICAEIKKQLNDEYDYLCSSECLKEYFSTSDMEFDEEGDIL